MAAGARPPGADGGAHRPRAGLGPEPARPGGVRRRARRRPPAARARADAGRAACSSMPGAIAGRRPVLQVAGCQGFVGGRAGQRRGDGRGRRESGDVTALATPPRVRREPARRAARRRRPARPAPSGRRAPAGRRARLHAARAAGHRRAALDVAARARRAVPGLGGGRRRGASAARRSWPPARLAGPLRARSPRGSSSLAMFALCLLAGGLRRRVPAARTTGARWRPASAAASRRCPASTSPTRARTSGRASCSPRAAPRWWPARPRSRCGRGATGASGFPLPALVLLVALAVVPAVVLAFEGEFVLRRASSACSCSASCGWRSCAGATRPPPPPSRLVAAFAGARRSPPPSTAASRGSTTRTGRCPPPPRARPRSPGTTTTRRSTGRATAASSCASRRASPRTGRPRTSTLFAGGAGSTASLGRPSRAAGAAARPGRGRALEPGHPRDRPQPPHADLRRGRRGVRRRRPAREHGRVPVRHAACSRPRGRSRAATPIARSVYTPRPTDAPAAARRHRRGRMARRTTVACSSTRTAPGMPRPAAGHGDRLPELDRGRCAADGPPGAPGRTGSR